MIYISSDGKEIDTATMNKTHLVNALVKVARQSAVVDLGQGGAQSAVEANLNVLKEEVLIRLK